MSDKTAIVVTTEHRGVFFGYVKDTPDLAESKTVTIEDARMCVYWPKENHGVVGLAKDGPNQGSKVSPAAPSIQISDVTSIMICTPEAIKAWEAEPWS